MERSLLEVEKILSKLPVASPGREEKQKPLRPLLYIENKHLNPANELSGMSKDKNKRYCYYDIYFLLNSLQWYLVLQNKPSNSAASLRLPRYLNARISTK